MVDYPSAAKFLKTIAFFSQPEEQDILKQGRFLFSNKDLCNKYHWFLDEKIHQELLLIKEIKKDLAKIDKTKDNHTIVDKVNLLNSHFDELKQMYELIDLMETQNSELFNKVDRAIARKRMMS